MDLFQKRNCQPQMSEKRFIQVQCDDAIASRRKTHRQSFKKMKQEALNYEFSDSSSPGEQISFFEEKNNVSVSVLTNGPGKTIIPWTP